MAAWRSGNPSIVGLAGPLDGDFAPLPFARFAFSISSFYIMLWPSFVATVVLNFVQPQRAVDEQMEDAPV
jgi:hypothetical protein